MVRGSNHRGWRGIVVGKLQPAGEDKITKGENNQGLDEKRNGNPQNSQRITEDDFALERKQQY